MKAAVCVCKHVCVNTPLAFGSRIIFKNNVLPYLVGNSDLKV